IPLLHGRGFNDLDTQKSPPVVLVSKSLAHFLWPGADPLGKRVKPSWLPDWRTVVGVVDDVVTYKTLPSGQDAQWASSVIGNIYFPATEGVILPPMHATIAVRVSNEVNSRTLERRLSALTAGFSPGIPVSKVQTMDQIVADSVSTPRATMWLFLAFAGLALLLGAVGIYGVISYSVAQRTREIGIRIAMGADRWDVLKMVLRQGSILTLAGVVLGVGSALLLTRLMASLLYGVQPTDPQTFTVVSLVVILVATLATYIPSRRATTVDPTVA